MPSAYSGRAEEARLRAGDEASKAQSREALKTSAAVRPELRPRPPLLRMRRSLGSPSNSRAVRRKK